MIKGKFISTLLLGLVSFSYTNVAGDISTSSMKQKIFFLHENNLMSANCVAEIDCNKPELISDQVQDYTLDEARMRIYWLAKNGSLYVKQFTEGTPIKQLLLPSGKNGKISYDILTKKLNLNELNNNDSKPICISGYHGEIIDAWIDPFSTDYKGNFSLESDEKFVRMLRNYIDDSVYIMVRNNESKYNVYWFLPDGSRKLFVKNLTNDEFDLESGNKIIFGFKKDVGIIGKGKDEKNYTFLDQINDQKSSLSLDNNKRIWTIFSAGPDKYKIGWCKFDNQCKHFESLKLDYRPRKLRVWESVDFFKSKTMTRCTSNEDCQDGCLLNPCWPNSKCECDGHCTSNPSELHKQHKRQVPYDMYNNQQSTPSSQQSSPQPSFSYWPSIFGK